MLLLVIVLGVCVLTITSARAQDPFGRVVVTGGGVQFFATTYAHYNTGVELANWTRVRINFNASASNGWRLLVKAADHALVSNDGAPNLSLDYLRLDPHSITSSNTSCDVNGAFTLTPAGEMLLEGDGTVNVAVSFTLTYKLGVLPSPLLMNVAWGFYSTQLIFHLISVD